MADFSKGDIVECVRSSDSEGCLQAGAHYTVESCGSEVRLVGVSSTWSYGRFRLVSKGKTAAKRYVRCLNNDGSARSYLKVGDVYEVTYDYGQEWEVVTKSGRREFMKSRFSPVLTNYDAEEEKVRKWLTTPTDPDTCKSCGAPAAVCIYH